MKTHMHIQFLDESVCDQYFAGEFHFQTEPFINIVKERIFATGGNRPHTIDFWTMLKLKPVFSKEAKGDL